MPAQPRTIGAGIAAAALAAVVGTAALPQSHAAPSAPATDEHGFVDSPARCSSSQTLMAYGRTPRALIVICIDPAGGLQYRGVRLSDGAGLQMAAGRGSDGSIVATNDGVTYSVSPSALLVAQGDTVLYRDSWTDFQTPRFSGPATTAPSTAGLTSKPTVSTTTVTPTPTASSAKPAG